MGRVRRKGKGREEGSLARKAPRLHSHTHSLTLSLTPSHSCTQNVINQFTAIGKDPRTSFYGNVTLGRDVSLAELREMYDAVRMWGAMHDAVQGWGGGMSPWQSSARCVMRYRYICVGRSGRKGDKGGSDGCGTLLNEGGSSGEDSSR